MRQTIGILSILISLFAAACGQTGTSGQVKGVVVQDATASKISGKIKLMPEKYLQSTPAPTTTLQPGEFIEVSVADGGKFVIKDIPPGRYYLDAAIKLDPCFLGAPGQVFNGAIVSFLKDWSPIGFSFKDGSSLIAGKTGLFEITAGKTYSITLSTPKCY